MKKFYLSLNFTEKDEPKVGRKRWSKKLHRPTFGSSFSSKPHGIPVKSQTYHFWRFFSSFGSPKGIYRKSTYKPLKCTIITFFPCVYDSTLLSVCKKYTFHLLSFIFVHLLSIIFKKFWSNFYLLWVSTHKKQNIYFWQYLRESVKENTTSVKN
jgi:hypothetical protein